MMRTTAAATTALLVDWISTLENPDAEGVPPRMLKSLRRHPDGRGLTLDDVDALSHERRDVDPHSTPISELFRIEELIVANANHRKKVMSISTRFQVKAGEEWLGALSDLNQIVTTCVGVLAMVVTGEIGLLQRALTSIATLTHAQRVRSFQAMLTERPEDDFRRTYIRWIYRNVRDLYIHGPSDSSIRRSEDVMDEFAEHLQKEFGSDEIRAELGDEAWDLLYKRRQAPRKLVEYEAIAKALRMSSVWSLLGCAYTLARHSSALFDVTSEAARDYLMVVWNEGALEFDPNRSRDFESVTAALIQGGYIDLTHKVVGLLAGVPPHQSEAAILKLVKGLPKETRAQERIRKVTKADLASRA